MRKRQMSEIESEKKRQKERVETKVKYTQRG